MLFMVNWVWGVIWGKISRNLLMWSCGRSNCCSFNTKYPMPGPCVTRIVSFMVTIILHDFLRCSIPKCCLEDWHWKVSRNWILCLQTVLDIFWMLLWVAGMHLQPCLSLQKLLSSFMWAWMPWMSTNGKWPQQREFYASLGIFLVSCFCRLAVAYIITSSHCCGVLGSLGQSFGLFSTLLVLILVGRAAFVFPLSALSNYIRKSSNTKIGIRQQVLTPPYMKYAVPLNIILHKTVVSMMILHL